MAFRMVFIVSLPYRLVFRLDFHHENYAGMRPANGLQDNIRTNPAGSTSTDIDRPVQLHRSIARHIIGHTTIPIISLSILFVKPQKCCGAGGGLACGPPVANAVAE
jgi:hypothetical protein